jgi:transposase
MDNVLPSQVKDNPMTKPQPPTLPIHNGCGWVNESLTLADRRWTCPNCGAELDRDFNAALNIRDEALRLAALDNSTRPVVSTSDVMPAEDSPIGGQRNRNSRVVAREIGKASR